MLVSEELWGVPLHWYVSVTVPAIDNYDSMISPNLLAVLSAGLLAHSNVQGQHSCIDGAAERGMLTQVWGRSEGS